MESVGGKGGRGEKRKRERSEAIVNKGRGRKREGSRMPFLSTALWMGKNKDWKDGQVRKRCERTVGEKERVKERCNREVAAIRFGGGGTRKS